MVVFGQRLLYSGKSFSNRAKVVVFGQSDCIRSKWLFSKKVVFFGQGGYIVVFGQKWLYSEKSCCIRAKWFYSVKVAVFWQNWL